MQSLLLMAALLLPLVGLALAFSKRWLSLGAVGLSLLSAVALIWMPSTFRLDWVPELGISLSMGLTPLSLPFFLLTEFLLMLVLARSLHEPTFPGLLFFGWSLLVLFSAQDLILFAIGWGFALLAGFFLLRDELSTRFALFQGAGWVLLLFAFVAMLGSAGNDASFVRLLSVKPMINAPIWLYGLVFLALVIACLLPLLIFPFHTWLQAGENHSSGLLLVLGAWTKVGVYGLLLFGAGMFPSLMHAAVPALTFLGVLTLVGASLVAMTRRKLHPFLLDAAMAQNGLILVGLASGQRVGFEGAILLSLAQGLALAALWGMPDPAALWPRRPRTAIMLVLGVLGFLGIPGFLSFPGLAFAFAGGWYVQPWVGVGLALGVVILLTAAVLLFTGINGEGEGDDRYTWSLLPLGLSLLFGMLPFLLVSPLWAALQPMMPIFGF